MAGVVRGWLLELVRAVGVVILGIAVFNHSRVLARLFCIGSTVVGIIGREITSGT
jgi:hypothetical protein